MPHSFPCPASHFCLWLGKEDVESQMFPALLPYKDNFYLSPRMNLGFGKMFDWTLILGFFKNQRVWE